MIGGGTNWNQFSPRNVLLHAVASLSQSLDDVIIIVIRVKGLFKKLTSNCGVSKIETVRVKKIS